MMQVRTASGTVLPQTTVRGGRGGGWRMMRRSIAANQQVNSEKFVMSASWRCSARFLH
jgi:hypothetical protein